MRLTIEPHEDGDHAVYEHGIYPGSSVLAGQPRRVFRDRGQKAELLRRHPNAEVIDCSTKSMGRVSVPISLADLSGLPMTPPGWFDPANAGERWDDDY